MRCYQDGEDIVLSKEALPLPELSEAALLQAEGRVLALNGALGPEERVAFVARHPSQLWREREGVDLLWQGRGEAPAWLRDAMAAGRVLSVNTAHSDWRAWLDRSQPQRWRIHVIGLGDVGGMLLTGLRLLGHGSVSRLGFYDPDPARRDRWHRELGQICTPFEPDDMAVESLAEDRLTDCDMLVFCASRGVPPLSQTTGDVRMVQLAGNGEILKPYVRQAVREGFKGLFCVVSDPVDQLCRVAQLTQAETASREGLRPLKADQIRGYGLGVMNGRAAWYARHNPALKGYPETGRAFGPHGKGLVIADSVTDYDPIRSEELTRLTLHANLEVREAGYKPFVAPALSSGAISLLHTLRGQWHYLALSLGDVFMGCKNRLRDGIQETECLNLPSALQERLRETEMILRSSF